MDEEMRKRYYGDLLEGEEEKKEPIEKLVKLFKGVIADQKARKEQMAKRVI